MDSVKEIIAAYESLGSVRATVLKTGYSWNKIVKTLSSRGYVLSETHAEILAKHELGFSNEEIASQIGLNKKTVQAYLPRVRPVYNENPSKNAIAIKKYRKKHSKS